MSKSLLNKLVFFLVGVSIMLGILVRWRLNELDDQNKATNQIGSNEVVKMDSGRSIIDPKVLDDVPVDYTPFKSTLEGVKEDENITAVEQMRERLASLLRESNTRLPAEKQQEVQAALLQMLKFNDPNQARYLNDLLGALIYQEHPLRTTGDLLELIALDTSLNSVFRDYAVQAFPNWFFVAFKNGKPEDEEGAAQYERMVESWSKVTSDGSKSISATSLMGMYHQFANVEDGKVREQVAESAVAIVNDPQGDEFARISSMQVAASLGDERVLATCRAKARNGSLQERRSAIAALGKLGDEQDASELRQMMAKSPAEDGLEPAFQGAIQAIEARVNERSTQ